MPDLCDALSYQDLVSCMYRRSGIAGDQLSQSEFMKTDCIILD